MMAAARIGQDSKVASINMWLVSSMMYDRAESEITVNMESGETITLPMAYAVFAELAQEHDKITSFKVAKVFGVESGALRKRDELAESSSSIDTRE